MYPQINCGGTEMVFYNLIKFGIHSEFSYEILVQRSGDNERIFKDLDIPIHQISFTSAKEYKSRLIQFFTRERFDVVHTHMDTSLPIVLSAAKEAGIPCRVAHSHNARVDIPEFLWPLFFLRHHPYEKFATHLFGCSHIALKWLFPMRWRKGHVINNGIDLDKFRFNADTRRQHRADNAIADSTKVFITVGRCTDQKNHKFILDLAKERIDKDELYIIIGDGPLFSILTKYKEAHNLDNVRFLGRRDDVAEWLCAADVFLFPSIYEGLGIVAIEAEASGLNVLATDTIPEEANMHLGNFHSIPLKNKTLWHQIMSKETNSNEIRSDLSHKALASDYNIINVVRTVEYIYNDI